MCVCRIRSLDMSEGVTTRKMSEKKAAAKGEVSPTKTDLKENMGEK